MERATGMLEEITAHKMITVERLSQLAPQVRASASFVDVYGCFLVQDFGDYRLGA